MDLLLHENTPADNGFRGQWRPVEYTPSPTSPQRFVLGCIVERGSRICSYKLLDDFSRFDCIYGRGTGSNFVAPLVKRLAEFFETALASEAGTPTPSFVSPQLSLGPWTMAKGASAGAVANRIFDAIVAMAPPPQADNRDKGFRPFPTDSVRLEVNNMLRLKLGLKFENVVLEQGFVEHEDHTLRINLKAPDRLGSVVSAWYGSFESVETQLLRHANDIDTARQLYSIERARMFVLKPDNQLMKSAQVDTATIDKIDNFITEMEWQANKRTWELSVLDSTESVAEDVVEFTR